MKVLLRTGSETARGGPRLRLHWYHGALLLAAFFGSLAVSYAQLPAGDAEKSALALLIIWLPYILRGFLLNIIMSFGAMAIATPLGIALGLLQISRWRLVRTPAWLLTHFLRNSPWLVILFAVMLLSPFRMTLPGDMVVMVPDWVKATIAFSLPVMANISEITRGAVNSIQKGQWDSAESLAFTRLQALRWVILPQCVKRSIPPWMNWYSLLTMATPMASILGVSDAVGNTQSAMEAAGARPDLLFPFYLFLLCLFFVYIYPVAYWTRRLESKYAVID